MLIAGRRAGDTIIEVLFAITIFAAIAIGAMAIMNQGISTAQNSLELNLVRNNIDSQAELLRYLQNAKLTSIGRGSAGTESSTDISRLADQWDKIVSLTVDSAADYDGLQTYDQCTMEVTSDESVIARPGDIGRVFFVGTHDANVYNYSESSSMFRRPGTFAQVRHEINAAGDHVHASEMVWIQVVRSSDGSAVLSNTVAYDFHIRACWEGSGPNVDLMKIGTIVRLYMPREGA